MPFKILDVPCGHGRIANALAERGYVVTGLDATPLFLNVAESDALSRGIQIRYVQGDMRKLPSADAEYDVLINWFTSFGYFDDDENRQVLREFHRVLKPGRKLLIDHQNRERIIRIFYP